MRATKAVRLKTLAVEYGQWQDSEIWRVGGGIRRETLDKKVYLISSQKPQGHAQF